MKKKVVLRGRDDRELVLHGDSLGWGRLKSSGDSWQRWLHNKKNIVNANELYTEKCPKFLHLCFVYFTAKKDIVK